MFHVKDEIAHIYERLFRADILCQKRVKLWILAAYHACCFEC